MTDLPATARRAWSALVVATAVVLGITVVLLVDGGAAQDRPGGASTAGPAGPAPGPSGLAWLSGASGATASDGTFATWRGRPLDVAGTWADQPDASAHLWQLQPGGEYAAWKGDLDLAVGGLAPGETWADAAAGRYDARWAAQLGLLHRLWGSGRGTLYLRFAHESNGDWYPWKVTASSARDFVTAWRRYRTLQRRLMPDASLVFTVNRSSVGSGVDWRTTFPGAGWVDVLGVDYYNQDPAVTTDAGFRRQLDDTDDYGAPVGLGAYLAFARQEGVPLAVPEWSVVADRADSAPFVAGMHAFFAQHAGRGPGQLLYEITFDVDQDSGRFALYPSGRAPEASAAYRRLF